MASSKERPSTLQILNSLEKSNCRECGLPTCMAFAALVYQGQRRLEECPRLEPEVFAGLGAQLAREEKAEWNGADLLIAYLDRFRAGVDLAARAAALGGWTRADRLAFHCLGKVFEMDPAGGLHSECHQNPWLHVPMLAYVLDSAGQEPSGDWVRFEALRGVSAWVPFFEHSCPEPLAQFARQDPTLLLDILNLFAHERDLPGFEADASFLLLPLPKVPFVFSYRAPDEEFPASFSVLLDRSAERNLDPESLFRLASGMTNMFRKIAERHGGFAR